MHQLLEWTRSGFGSRTAIRCRSLRFYAALSGHPSFSGRQQPARPCACPVIIAPSRIRLFCSLFRWEAAVEDNKEEYYRCLRHAQESLARPHPDYGDWLLFFCGPFSGCSDDCWNKPVPATLMTSCRCFRYKFYNWRTVRAALLSNRLPKQPAPTSIRSKTPFCLTNAGLLLRRGSSRGTWYVKAV